MQITLELDELLAKEGMIALIWSLEDIAEIRPDLTENQAWEVLKTARDGHDANCGVTYESLEWIAADMFGSAPDTDEEAAK